jgi:hypothetical protein
MLVRSGDLGDLRHLGCRDVFGIDSTDSPTFSMDLEHDLCCTFRAKSKIVLQDHDDEVHRGEIVIEQNYAPHGRRAGFNGLLFDFCIRFVLDRHAGFNIPLDIIEVWIATAAFQANAANTTLCYFYLCCA